MADLHVEVDDIELRATWLDENLEVRSQIEAHLPVEGEASRWGEELYFPVTIDANPERTREEVPAGTLAYWPDGPAICLFWGPTPASVDDTPKAASPVAPFATLEDVTPLDSVSGGARVRLDRS